jgi:hypothetical protein
MDLGLTIRLQSKVKVVSTLMKTARDNDIRKTNRHVDSQWVIVWMRSSRAQRSISLHGCLQNDRYLKASFSVIHMHHIYSEYDQDADKLYKPGYAGDPGSSGRSFQGRSGGYTSSTRDGCLEGLMFLNKTAFED